MSNTLDAKQAIPNKVLQEDGSITDLVGNLVLNATEIYNNKLALPNKVLNPDGSYSPLVDILGGGSSGGGTVVNIFTVVSKLPTVGDGNKIYLIPNENETYDEYHYHNGKWDSFGVLDTSNLITKAGQ
ncbi:MAG: hypothetical protein K2P14_10250 [Anaeroplasmataceae bacterium]|nr:hypothetical protein [Anaeroplasmataceae bacterium]